jgi:toxin secretion/phage lysis holin
VPELVDKFEIADGLRKMFLENWLLKSVLSGLSTLLVFLFGRPDEAAKALMALMALDLATGIWAAGKAKGLSSKIGFQKTLTKLVGYFIAVSVGNLIGIAAPLLGFTRTIAITYLCIVEGISNIENLSRVGVKRIEGLMDKLKQTKDNFIPASQAATVATAIGEGEVRDG